MKEGIEVMPHLFFLKLSGYLSYKLKKKKKSGIFYELDKTVL